MCGICGKLNFNRQKRVNQNLIRQMMDMIQYRGPDGSGEFLSGPVGLGHRRLSIIDIETGTQPMSNEDDSVWVVYNGEIYNFQELRIELKERGHQFKSETDTEVIVHLYEELGDQCVTRLQGMFAFALWDERQQRHRAGPAEKFIAAVIRGEVKQKARAHQHGVKQPEPPVSDGPQVRAGDVFNRIHVRIRKADWFANARIYGSGLGSVCQRWWPSARTFSPHR